MSGVEQKQFFYRFLEIKDGFYFNNEALGGLIGYVFIDASKKSIALRPLSALFPDRGLVNIVGLNNIYTGGVIFDGDPGLIINGVPHATVQIGTIIMYGGNTEPTGWFFCNGKSIPKAQFPKLFDVIGYTYTSQAIINGNTLFTLPDFRHRLVKGFDATQTDYNQLGKTGGKVRHTLNYNEMPNHGHSGTVTPIGIGHTHNYYTNSPEGMSTPPDPYGSSLTYRNNYNQNVNTTSVTATNTVIDHTHVITTKTNNIYNNNSTDVNNPGPVSENASFSVIQPSVYMSYIIKY